jgi:hypothetical protein
MYTHVGLSILLGYHREFFVLTNSKNLVSSGLLYVRDRHLHHVATLTSGQCKNLAGYHWKLSHINYMELVHGNITITGSDRHHSSSTQQNHLMDPGLKIVFKNRKALVMAMPDAENFCARLSLHIEQLFQHERTGTRRSRHPRTKQKGNYTLNAITLQRTPTLQQRSHQLVSAECGEYSVPQTVRLPPS